MILDSTTLTFNNPWIQQYLVSTSLEFNNLEFNNLWFQTKKKYLQKKNKIKYLNPIFLMDTCKFHKYGHCKFGSGCRKFHSQDICGKTMCDKSTFNSRHPIKCKYQTRFGFCQFGTLCSFLHVNTEKENDIETLKKILLKLLNFWMQKKIK